MITTRAMPALLSVHQWRVASGTAAKNDFADPLGAARRVVAETALYEMPVLPVSWLGGCR